MTDTVESLSQEVTRLKQQNDQAVSQANGFVVQLDAHKQMLSESIQSCLNLRTQNLMFQKQLQEFSSKIQELQRLLDAANQKLATQAPVPTE